MYLFRYIIVLTNVVVCWLSEYISLIILNRLPNITKLSQFPNNITREWLFAYKIYGYWMVNSNNEWIIFPHLTGECPNVTLCYKLRRIFFTPKFDQIRPKIATFRLFFGYQVSQIVLGIAQLNPQLWNLLILVLGANHVFNKTCFVANY